MLSKDRLWFYDGTGWIPARETLAGRQATFEAEILDHVRQGYQITVRSDTQVSMLRPKKFSSFWAIAWFLLCGFGVLVYVFYYMGKRDDILVLNRDSYLRMG